MRLTEKDWKDKRAGYPWTVHPVESYNDLKYYLKLAEYTIFQSSFISWRSTGCADIIRPII